MSVIVRARDEALCLERCLGLIGRQRSRAEVAVIYVDRGSRDRSMEIARAHGSTVLGPEPGPFSFGGALNRGAARAQAEILVTLSAHAWPRDGGWLDQLRRPCDDPAVACATGDRTAPMVRGCGNPSPRTPHWHAAGPIGGYSNAAGAFRADLWRTRRFRDDLPACEDKEWALHLAPTRADVRHRPVFDRRPRPHARFHAQHLRPGETGGRYAAFLDVPPRGPRELEAQWWSDLRWYDSSARARLSHRRAARLLGAYAGQRAA